MVRADGIEPTTSVWKTEVLPLNYARIYKFLKTGREFSKANLERQAFLMDGRIKNQYFCLLQALIHIF